MIVKMLRLARKQNLLRSLALSIEVQSLVQNIIKLKVNNTDVLAKNYEHIRLLDRRKKKIGKIRNICFITSRARGTYRYFKLSRMFVRELGNAGFFMGVRKASF